MNVLMVGVDQKRIGGMWTVAETYLHNKQFNEAIQLHYVATNTYGSVINRIIAMLLGYAQIIVFLIRGNIDLVHIHMAEKGSTFRKGIVVWLCRLFHKKVIVQLHAGPFMAWYGTLSARKQHWIQKMFVQADAVCALGEYWRRELMQLIDEKKLKVLYNGSHCPDTNPYQPDGNLILYLGVMKKAKGTFDLLKAMEYADSRLEDSVKLYLCGTPEEDGIEQEIINRHLENRVKMLGWISKEERLRLFEQTRFCVHPSYFEALSMTVIESMCYGIPIITTDISTSPELVGEVEQFTPGDWKKLGEMIVQWSKDRAMRCEISAQLYERAKQKFSEEINIASTLQIYKEVLYGKAN